MFDMYQCPVCQTVFEGQQVKAFANGQMVVVCSNFCGRALESMSPEKQKEKLRVNKGEER